jgi:hypothetical protein
MFHGSGHGVNRTSGFDSICWDLIRFWDTGLSRTRRDFMDLNCAADRVDTGIAREGVCRLAVGELPQDPAAAD